ncbi:MAG: hypothetical protein RIM72_08730 [Alphaproteobacteria bacterium]
MKHLLFNAVVLASLGYLFAAEGRIDIPFLGDDTEAAAPAISVPVDSTPAETAPAADVAETPAVETAVEPAPVAEADPEIATAATEEVAADPAEPAEPAEQAREIAELPAPVSAEPVRETPAPVVEAAAEPQAPAVETRVAVTEAPVVEPPVTSYDPNAGVIAPPPAEDIPQAAAETQRVTLEPLPDLGEAESVAALPRVSVDPNASVLSSAGAQASAPRTPDPLDLALGFQNTDSVQLASGQAMMSPSERVRDLDRMIEDMELFFLEHTID